MIQGRQYRTQISIYIYIRNKVLEKKSTCLIYRKVEAGRCVCGVT